MQMKSLNRFGYTALFGALFLVVLYKVLHVPVTIDELPAVFHYSKFSVWEIMMYPDHIPNNHILNTLLVKGSMLLFGQEQWAVRLPNLLAFLLYGLGVFRILRLLLGDGSPWFLAGALLFINPYLLDFFGLARGYGLSLALEILAAGFLLEGIMRKAPKYIWYALVSATLASYANFTALVFWAAVTLIAGIWFLAIYHRHPKKALLPLFLMALFSLAYLALIMVPLQKMHATDEFQYWTSHGFYQETVISLIHNWYYHSPVLSHIPHAWFLLPVALATGGALLPAFRRNKNSSSETAATLPLPRFLTHPGFIAVILLLLPALINMAQTKILGTPNLSGRTALLFYPLLSLVFVAALRQIPHIRHPLLSGTATIALSLLLLANLTHRTSLKSVREWDFDQNTLEVMAYLHEQHPQRTVSLKTSWFFHSSFYFYQYTGKAPWLDLQPYDYQIDIQTPAEYYYIFAEDYEKLTPRFEIAYKFCPERWLLRQKKN